MVRVADARSTRSLNRRSFGGGISNSMKRCERISIYSWIADTKMLMTVGKSDPCERRSRTEFPKRAVSEFRFVVSRAKSTAASVCPARANTPALFARNGKTWPGRVRSAALVAGLIPANIVAARSAAEIPVVVPSHLEADTKRGVKSRAVVRSHQRNFEHIEMLGCPFTAA